VPRLAGGAIAAAVAKVPDEFLAGDARFASPAEARAAYAGHLERRLAAASLFVEEALRALQRSVARAGRRVRADGGRRAASTCQAGRAVAASLPPTTCS